MALLATLALSGCVIVGVEPDVIGDGESDDDAGATGEGDTSGATTTGDGDGDLDAGDGDGDGDTGMAEDDAGDGDGDTTTGDGDGDGDGDGTGDGDGDPVPCAEFDPTVAMAGANPVELADDLSAITLSCGSDGPEAVFSYTASEGGTVEFSLSNWEVEASLALVADNCVPLGVELGCATAPDAVSIDMLQGQTVYIVVDAASGPATGSLDIN